MINQIRTQIVDQYHDLTPLQVSKRLIGIVSDLLLKSAKNILVKVLDIIKSLTEAAFNILDAPIDIPILGPLYKQITSSDPSVLDIVVLVMAIPATIMYKIAAREAPFPDNATTATMINATDFQTFKDIVHRESSSSTGPLIHAKMNQSRAAVAVTAPVAAATASTDAGTTPASSTAPSTGDWTATYRVFNIIGRFFSAVNAGLQAPIEQFNLELEKDESGKLIPLSTPWQITEAISTILGLLPNIILSFDQTGTWEAIMSQVVADMGILVTIVGKTPLLKDNTIWKENVSPALTIVLQMANLAPSIGNFVMLGDKRKASDSVGLTATSFARIANISYASAKILYPKGGTAKIVGVGVLIVGQNSGLLNGCLTISTAGMICANK
ncbi:hypothetical protein AMS68_002147 [Peltaster fructicola]|uniref:Uncharacterized protein n=1 Tax=Peltaster fructicola TaxID=286661 RepID=A0A6H0XQ77_9PEZI|nr:hypothetical protein AMS68_002147 [Peltaster fructicola]